MKLQLPSDPKTREQLKNASLILIVVVGGLIFMPSRYTSGMIGINDMRKEESKLIRQVNVLKGELRDNEAILARREQLIAERGELAPRIEYFQSRLPSTVDMPELLRELDAIANRRGQMLSVHDPAPPVERGAIVELPRNIELHSDYHGFGAFLNDIENAERFAKVDDINIEYDKDNPGRHRVRLTLSTFIFNEEKLIAEASPNQAESTPQ